MSQTLSELLGIELFEMHDAMDKLGWEYTKVPDEERTKDIRCCGVGVILRGIAGVDTGQCVHCPKTLQNMAGLVPLLPRTVGFIEPELYEDNGEVWFPADEDDLADYKRIAVLDVWTKKAML